MDQLTPPEGEVYIGAVLYMLLHEPWQACSKHKLIRSKVEKADREGVENTLASIVRIFERVNLTTSDLEL